MFAGMFLKMKVSGGRRFSVTAGFFVIVVLFCFVYKPSKTSWECTSDHNTLISRLCSLGCFNQRVFDQNCSDTSSLPWL